jgi:hypothetical protein
MKKGEEIRNALVDASAAVNAAALAEHDPKNAAAVATIAGGSVLAAGILKIAGGWLAERIEQRRYAWIRAYLGGDVVDEAKVEAELHAMGDNPAVREVVIQGIRAINEVIADSAVPVLARLTREYVSSGRKADGFFRGVQRLMMDIDSDDFIGLRELLLDLEGLGVWQGVFLGAEGGQSVRVQMVRPEHGNEKVRCPPNHRRIFALLKASTALASELPSGGTGPDETHFERAVFDRLLSLIKGAS